MACFLKATAGSLVRRGQVSQAEAPCRWQGIPRGSRPADWPGRKDPTYHSTLTLLEIHGKRGLREDGRERSCAQGRMWIATLRYLVDESGIS